MQQAADAIVYNGMTAAELAAAYNVHGSIPDPAGYQKENAELAQAAEAKLNPIKDIAYGGEPIQKLDIYAPSGAANAPVLIDIHGGGWTQGTKNTRAIPAEAVMSKGVVWVPIDYGLAPSYRMEQIIDHVRRAVAWVYQNIAQYGGDPNRLYVSGNSAGGHLTGTTLMPGWHGDYGIPEDAVKGAVPMSGIFDLDGHVHAGVGPQEALKMTLQDSRQSSPLFNLPARPVPVVVSYGEPELEAFIDESNKYAAALEKAGCDVTVVEVPGAHHFAMSRELAHPNGALFKAVMAMMGV